MNILRSKSLWQFIKFGIVGASNTAISLVLYYLLVYFGIHYLIANTVGFMAGVVNAYYWNNKYVFQKKTSGSFGAFMKTFTSYFLTFLLSTALLFIMVHWMSVSSWVAPIINLAITVPLNFIINKYWAFK